MKIRIPLLLTVSALAMVHLSAPAQGRRGPGRTAAQILPTNPAIEHALLQALTGPDGEYAAYAEYAAIVAKFGQVQPYASILRSEERHIAALKRHLEMRGITTPENAFIGTVTAPATLQEAAQAAITAEERNVALYGLLIEQAKDAPDLVRVFTHLQFASREHHLPAFKAAAAKGGQLPTGEFGCGIGFGLGAGQGRGGPPPWAGGAGKGGFEQGGRGQGWCCGACVGADGAATGGAQMGAGRGYRHGAARFQGQ